MFLCFYKDSIIFYEVDYKVELDLSIFIPVYLLSE